MALSRRVIAAVAVAVAVGGGVTGAVLIAGGDGGSGGGTAGEGDDAGGEDVRTVQPGAPGEAGRELTGDDAAGVDAPGHTPADTAFMQGMLAHHAQALEMTALVGDRTRSDDIPLLAERITLSQEAEIELIEQWLTDRGEDVPDPADHTDHSDDDGDDDGDGDDHAGHDLMPGMATPEQLEALEAARGPDFDVLFLELMVAHHQGAITMVDELYAAGGGLEPAADALARDVEADQSIEIRRMTEMLAGRG